MAVPFCMGKVIDLIYSSSNDTVQMMETLSSLGKYLCGIFILGGMANFGRVYLIQISGEWLIKTYLTIRLYKLKLVSVGRCTMRSEPTDTESSGLIVLVETN